MFNRSYFAAAFFALSYFPGPLPVPPPVCLHAEVTAPSIVVGEPAAPMAVASVGESHSVNLALQGPSLTLEPGTTNVSGEISAAPAVDVAGAPAPAAVLSDPAPIAMPLSIASPEAGLTIPIGPAVTASIGSATVTLVAEEC